MGSRAAQLRNAFSRKVPRNHGLDHMRSLRRRSSWGRNFFLLSTGLKRTNRHLHIIHVRAATFFRLLHTGSLKSIPSWLLGAVPLRLCDQGSAGCGLTADVRRLLSTNLTGYQVTLCRKLEGRCLNSRCQDRAAKKSCVLLGIRKGDRLVLLVAQSVPT